MEVSDDLDFRRLRKHVERRHREEIVNSTEGGEVTGERAGIAGDVEQFRGSSGEEEIADARGKAVGGWIQQDGRLRSGVLREDIAKVRAHLPGDVAFVRLRLTPRAIDSGAVFLDSDDLRKTIGQRAGKESSPAIGIDERASALHLSANGFDEERSDRRIGLLEKRPAAGCAQGIVALAHRSLSEAGEGVVHLGDGNRALRYIHESARIESIKAGNPTRRVN